MSSTETNRAAELAAEIFETAIVPLAAARQAAGEQAYFPLAPEAAAGSYYEPAERRVMQPADFEFPGGGTTEGLIDALTAHWQQQGETDLAALNERLKQLAALLREEAQAGDGSVSILCYTMF